MSIRRRLKKGSLALGPLELRWEIGRREKRTGVQAVSPVLSNPPYALHIGPGAEWKKPDASWLTVDVDPLRADIVVNFNDFEALPLATGTVEAIYASHVFEHMSVYRCPRVLAECHRVLAVGGTLRIVVPDVETSIANYVAKNDRFPLFERRRRRAADTYGESYTLFECLKEDFVSRTSQRHLLGEQLAHQNAWDFESLCAALTRAGFDPRSISRAAFRSTRSPRFAFEGTYSSEANEEYRSLYVEASK